MTDTDLWLKNADANSFFDRLPVIETKTLKDYLHGKLSPKETASDYVKGSDLEPVSNPSFHGHLEHLAAIAYDVSNLRGQIKVIKLLVAIRDLRYHLKKGWHSKREMDLRKQTDLSLVHSEFAEAIEDGQVSYYSCSSILSPYVANTKILGLWCEVLALNRGASQIRPESNSQWINLSAFLVYLASVNTSRIGLAWV